MNSYLLAALVIFIANVVPAFAPPTWTILVFFVIQHNLNSITLIFVGVIFAVLGRAVLAYTFRQIRGWLPRGYVENMERIGHYIENHPRGALGLLALFFLSPISSAQLFEGAGIIKEISLKPLLAAFGAGRILTYSIYVSGAMALKATSIGELIKREFTSPIAITIQVIMIVGLIALGNVKWKLKD